MIYGFDSLRDHTVSVQYAKWRPMAPHQRHQALRSSGRIAQWEPFTNLALAILAQAWEDITKDPRAGAQPWELSKHRVSREDALEFLTDMTGSNYQDRIFWLEVAYPDQNPQHMDRVLQSRLAKQVIPDAQTPAQLTPTPKKTQHTVLVSIAQANGGVIRIVDTIPILQRRGVLKESRNAWDTVQSVLRRNDGWVRVAPGTYRWTGDPEDAPK